MPVKAAEAIVKFLEQEGVDTVFGYPGGYIVHVYEALRKSGIRHVLVRQESAAAHCANGYARVSGKTGVCISTSGPGATNLITGIATAYMDSIPLVVLTGQVPSSMIGRDVFQEADITGATESFTKHNFLVKDARELPRIFREAFHIASTGRPGPVLIDLPHDIQQEDITFKYPETVHISGYKPTVKGHMGQIKRALKAIAESERPLILAGGGVNLAGAQAELVAFSEKSGIPVVHTLMGKGAFPSNHPHYVGMIGTHGFAHANEAVKMADLVIFIGARIADRSAGGTQILPENMTIVHIDVDPAEIGKIVGTHIPLVGDVREILKQMNEKIKRKDTAAWLETLRSMKPEVAYRTGDFVNPKKAIRLLSDKLSDTAIMVADVGQNQFWAARHFEDLPGRKFMTSGGMGTMGYGLPAAIGAKIAAPDRQVVAVAGDGGFQMSLFELGTIAANQIGLVMVLFNNANLGMVREMQNRMFGNTSQTALERNPDFVMLAKAYGIDGIRVRNDDELEAAFEQALSHKGPFLVECMVDPDESTL
ncbi:MAG TPA: biosynthetic-type acetolactate synthase large subunit [Thermoclostridium caenicola]|nr:biosynthetic-type acetolactate synthase large subunit [Thermoclostridium caenicola]HOK43302.1 biosynthetic-type acetolactate synthase large subunit [Thermoclostridium caenicola]HOL84536.1 biosynthetic-type acetolactate synthase large subunit [Thermoclostridium caenicola]HOP72859.1 biosynthetic-type acetolactate synthase large subunit [Thermoclostridium caenicola]HPO76547.1 biosynthetic-type acetolactate synthase large subunit [Thermoclostridium caenicola]